MRNLWTRPELQKKLDWYPLLFDYSDGITNDILSSKYIEKQKKSPRGNFDQEYCCSFTSTYTSAIKYSDLTFKNMNSKDYNKSVDLLKEIWRDYGTGYYD